MRISTNMMFDIGMAGLQRQQTQQLELQEKIAAGTRILKPSDDPAAAASVLALDHAKGVNAQYGTNADNAKTSLSLEEVALADAARALQDIKTLAIQAGNPVLTNDDRASIAVEMRGLYSELLGISNRTDVNNEYLFSGFQGATQPFSESSPGVVAYAGDEGRRLVQIGPQRRIAVGDSGSEIFQRIRAGNGTFVVEPGANTGTGVAGSGTVRDAQAWTNAANSRDYSIRFHVDGAQPPVTTYDIVNDATNVSMLTGVAPVAGPHARTYQAGALIDLRRLPADPIVTPWDTGVHVDITGAPATGDRFDIDRSPAQDVFATVHELIDNLNADIAPNPASRASYQNRLNAAAASVDRGLDNMITAQASVGIRLRELEQVQETTADIALHYDEDRSRLIDLDYAQALSEVAHRQFTLEAAQRSYVAVTRLTLFDFL
jgi:flagellar hook-associated protein 3 FlgL